MYDIAWLDTYAAVYRSKRDILKPIEEIDTISLNELIGIEYQKLQLVENTENFILGKPANNALLWGARGTGKSSLIKAVLNNFKKQNLRIIEINKEDLSNLLDIVDGIRDLKYKFIVFCDDLEFDNNDTSYKALKTILDGSIEIAPKNILIYATSNRRHLVAEYMSENTNTLVKEGELHYGDSVEEKISLSDRFGLWLSFYQGTEEDYFNIVDNYFRNYKIDKELLHKEAKKFSALRGGSRSGRCAKQFFNYFVNKI